MFILINKLSKELYIDLNNRKMEEAKRKAEELEMASSMLKKYIDWRLISK
jgi:hypothetical protein